MATYNRGRHILPSIASVLGQSFRNFELIVVGDHCIDDTEVQLASKYPQSATWINLPTRGGSQSFPNNAGIAAARGTYIAYIGHDDIWAPDHLASINALFSADENLDFAVSGAVFHMPEGVPGDQITGIFEDERAKYEHFFPPSSFAHKRNVTQRVGGWQPPQEIKAPVDADFLLRSARAEMRFQSTNKITVHKFAAGHRYLSYVAHESGEQESMLQKLAAPDYANWRDRLIDDAKANGTFMCHKYLDFGVFQPGELANQNAQNKGLVQRDILPIGDGITIEQKQEFCALDWAINPDRAIRWSIASPRPKYLLPVCSAVPALVRFVIAHTDPDALASLCISCRGQKIEAAVSRLRSDDGRYLADAIVVLNLDAHNQTIITFELSGSQIPSGQNNGRGLGIGDITLVPANGKQILNDTATLSNFEHQLNAMRQSNSWKLTGPLRFLKKWLSRTKP